MSFKYIQPKDIDLLPGTVIIDIRDTDYNSSGHFRNSINIPIEEVQSQQNKQIIEKSQHIICFCMTSKQRAVNFASYIKDNYPDKKVSIVEGGYLNIKDKMPEDCSEVDNNE